jgi:hypothetical protein
MVPDQIFSNCDQIQKFVLLLICYRYLPILEVDVSARLQFLLVCKKLVYVLILEHNDK